MFEALCLDSQLCDAGHPLCLYGAKRSYASNLKSGADDSMRDVQIWERQGYEVFSSSWVLSQAVDKLEGHSKSSRE